MGLQANVLQYQLQSQVAHLLLVKLVKSKGYCIINRAFCWSSHGQRVVADLHVLAYWGQTFVFSKVRALDYSLKINGRNVCCDFRIL